MIGFGLDDVVWGRVDSRVLIRVLGRVGFTGVMFHIENGINR